MGRPRIEHWDNGGQQAAAGARGLLGGPGNAPAYPVPYFWSDQYDVKLRLLGVPQPGDQVHVVEDELDEHRFVAAYGREGRTVAVFAVNRMGRPRAYRKVVNEGVSFPSSAPS